MNSNSVLKEYDQWHESMARTEEKDVLNLPWYKTVVRHLPDLNGKRVIEVGCGRGVFASYLASRYPGAQISAVDFSASAIQIASANYAGQANLRFYVGNAESLDMGSGDFDYYISCETIEHVFTPLNMISEIHRVLKPKGGFILTTENYFNAYILEWIRCWIQNKPFESGCGVQPHENFFIFPMLLKMFRKNGLMIKETQSNHYQWMLFPRISPTKLCTQEVKSPVLKRLLKPFGRHYTYIGENQ